jgi:hypothetical protein
MTLYFLCLCKGRKTFGGFQLEAPRAYECKQILGLCHMSLPKIAAPGEAFNTV